MGLGKKLKEFRIAKDWTLADLAKQSGVALSSLSRMETGKMTGTLESHIRIARALGVRLPELYADLDPSEKVVEHRRGGQPPTERLLQGKGASSTLLTSGSLQRKMLPALLSIQPGKILQRNSTPTGTETFIYLLRGQLEAVVGQERFRLTSGDSIYFRTSFPHTLKNTASTVGIALRITSPPTL